MSSGPLIEARHFRACKIADMKRKDLKIFGQTEKHVIQLNTLLNWYIEVALELQNERFLLYLIRRGNFMQIVTDTSTPQSYV